jgi:hypothetical protein
MSWMAGGAARSAVIAGALVASWSGATAADDDPETIRARVQTHPGGPVVETDMPVHRVPTDLPSVPAAEAPLEDHDLVLGVVVDGTAKAYPIRYLALHEVVDDRVGDLPVAPTW